MRSAVLSNDSVPSNISCHDNGVFREIDAQGYRSKRERSFKCGRVEEGGGCSRTFTCIYTNTQVNSSSLTLRAKGHGRRCCQIGTVSSVVPVSPLWCV